MLEGDILINIYFTPLSGFAKSSLVSVGQGGS